MADNEDDIVRRPFEEAIKAFGGRGEILRKDQFLALEEASRARAWTMARSADVDVIADMYDAVNRSIAGGEGFREFVDRVEDVMETRGWDGTEPWHTRLIFDQNVGMAYSAGRFEQATQSGVKYWRYLASDADEPRDEHRQFYDQVYPMGDGPMPPLDFGCACGWEAVFDDEIEADQVREDGPDVPEDQEFQFAPASFFQPKRVSLSAYPQELHDVLRKMADEDDGFVVTE